MRLAKQKLDVAITRESMAEMNVLRKQQLESGQVQPEDGDQELQKVSLDQLIEIEQDMADTRQKAYKHYEDMLDKRALLEEKKVSRAAKVKVWQENESLKQRWYAMPPYMKKFCPEREDPAAIYSKIRHALLVKTEVVCHEAITALLKRFK